MRLSTSLQRNILETTVGGVLDRFMMRNRRLTLSFEDIIGEYILTCERHGHGTDIGKLSETWAVLAFTKLMPAPAKKLYPPIIINHVLKKSWRNLGIVDDLRLEEDGRVITLTTRNESITRVIGGNEFMPRFFNGTISVLYRSKSQIVESLQGKDSCKYEFRLMDQPFKVKGKSKAVYNRLNHLNSIKGFTLSDAIKSRTLQLREGYKIYFRGKRLTVTENTIFHLAGNADILLDEVPPISHNFFREIIEEDSTKEQKLTLLKNLLQIMGWGIVNIIIKDRDRILIEIKSPPHGMQSEKDNWTVLSKIIHGYLWIINKNLKISNIKEDYKNLKITYLKD